MGVENQDVASPDTSDETLDDVVVSQPQASEVEDIADSSPAEAKDEPKSLLSVVRDAVDKTKAPESSPGDERGQQAAPTKEPDNEHFTDVPFHQHPRFRELVSQRNALKEPAARFNDLVQFMNENALSGEELTQAVNWAALRKRDPEAAWAEIKPIVQELLVTIGEVLPSDIRAQVQAGQLSPEAAKMLAKERAKATLARGQMTFSQAQEARRKAVERQTADEALQASLRDAVREWSATQAKDPDFQKKQDDLKKEILFLQHTEGKPNTPEGVKEQLGRALKAVNSAIAARRPRRPDIRPVTGGSTGGNAQSEPRSMLDVVRQARAAAH